MSPQLQIEKQRQDDLNKFQSEVYKGAIAVPKRLILYLQEAYMAVPPQFHSFLANRVKVICSKKVEELTNEDISAAITIILKCPLKDLHNGFINAVEAQIAMEKFVLCYNSHVDEFQKKLQMKQANLISLSSNNGLKRVIN